MAQDDTLYKELEKVAKKEGLEIFKISSITKQGLKELLVRVEELLKEIPKENLIELNQRKVYKLNEDKNELNDTSDYIGKEISEEDLKKINIENNGMIKVLDKEELNNLQIDTKNEKQTFAIDYKTEEVYYLEGYENDDDILYSLTDINKLAVE